MFHPNVYADGGICLDILQNRWSPTYDVSAILTSIQSLLDEPNPNSPANSVAAQLYQVKPEDQTHLNPQYSKFSWLNKLLCNLYLIGFQENRREYEKRVASIVEQSWLIFSEETDGKEDASKAEAAEWSGEDSDEIRSRRWAG